MEDYSTFSCVLFAFGILFVLVSSIEYFFPAKYKNLKGYRTKNSLKNEESWNFAQKKYAKSMFYSALFLIILSFIGLVLSIPNVYGFITSLAIIIILAIRIYIKTEKALKDKFY